MKQLPEKTNESISKSISTINRIYQERTERHKLWKTVIKKRINVILKLIVKTYNRKWIVSTGTTDNGNEFVKLELTRVLAEYRNTKNQGIWIQGGVLAFMINQIGLVSIHIIYPHFEETEQVKSEYIESEIESEILSEDFILSCVEQFFSKIVEYRLNNDEIPEPEDENKDELD